MTLNHSFVDTPLGKLTLIANDTALVAVLWKNKQEGRVKLHFAQENPTHPILMKTHLQFLEYFQNIRKEFDIPILFQGTVFQKKVWDTLTKIPYGETRSYLDIAKSIGSPLAVRAVGFANSKNPLSIIVPCHRVIGKNGNLTGYAGGMNAKSFLLSLENIQADLF